MNRQIIKQYDTENGKPQGRERRNFLSKLGRIFLGTTLLSVFTRNFASARTSSSETTAAVPLLGSGEYLGSLGFFAGNFPPLGWMFCDGRLLQISQYEALYSLIGTTYGGDGSSTFALPDLRGRVPMHAGTGNGLPGYALAQVDGTENCTLGVTQIPAHNHVQYGSQNTATSDNPNGLLPAVSREGSEQYASGNNVSLNNSAIGALGGGWPHNNMQPYLVINCCICVEGIYPPMS